MPGAVHPFISSVSIRKYSIKYLEAYREVATFVFFFLLCLCI